MAAIGAIASIAGGLVGAMGAMQQGKAQQAALNYEAQMREKKAAEERAAAQRDAIEKTDEATRVGSRAVAVAAASGGGVVNPTILDIYGETIERGDLNARSAMYGGESRARGELDQAAAARAKGKAAASGAKWDAAGSIFGGLSKAFG